MRMKRLYSVKYMLSEEEKLNRMYIYIYVYTKAKIKDLLLRQ